MESNSIKFKFKKSQRCAFMLQGLRISSKDYLLGSTLDCWLFLYQLNDSTPQKTVAQLQTDPYPVSNAFYSQSTNSLVCGTAGGTVMLFRNFSKSWLREMSVFRVNGEPTWSKLSCLVFMQENSIYCVNYPNDVYKINPNQPTDTKIDPLFKLPSKVLNALFIQDPGYIALSFLQNKQSKPPILLKQLNKDSSIPRCDTYLEQQLSNPCMTTCMSYCQKTNQIITGNYKGEVMIFSIVVRDDQPYCQLDYCISTGDEGPILCAQARSMLTIVTLMKIRFINVVSQKGESIKKQNSQPEIFNLFTWITDTKYVMGQKDLVILRDYTSLKECKFRYREQK